MANAQFLACDAKHCFGATFSGVHGSGAVWADFPTQEKGEVFALFCYFEGHSVYLSRSHADRNRVVASPKTA